MKRWIVFVVGVLTFTGLLISSFISVSPEKALAKSSIPSPDKQKKIHFGEAYSIIVKSCMPCHNRNTLPSIIKEVKKNNFTEVEDETKPRILGALEGLLERIEEGELLSFTSEKEIHQFYRSAPDTMFTMVEKNVMPPPFAPGLMDTIGYKRYEKLKTEKRLILLKYANQYSPNKSN